MKNIITISLCLLAELIVSTLYAQKRIVVLGSSTAAGNGAFPTDSSWVSRLQASFRKNTSDGIDTIIDNRAYPGYVTYRGMPSDYVMPANRPDPGWAPDPDRNVTWVLSQNPKPDIVILSYVSNDVNLYPDYTEKETMDNLRLMFQRYNAAGITCFVSSTQPRNDMTDAQRTMLRELRDSIVNTFKIYSLIFWDDLVTTDGLNMLRSEVNSGDGIHPNNYGHRLIFQKVAAKNIFGLSATAPLPLVLKGWDARLKNNSVVLSWQTASEESSTSFEIQRSNNGVDFQTIYSEQGKGNEASYSWTDATPVNGKNYYRLKISEPTNHTIYSRTITIINNRKQLVTSLYTDPSQLHLQLQANSNQSADITIIDYSGAILKKQSVSMRGANTSVVVPITGLRSGDYFVRIVTSGGSNAVERFSIMK